MQVIFRDGTQEGFEWTFEMTDAGVLDGHVQEDELEVGPDLQPGRYRFVYNGIVSGAPLAVEFHYRGVVQFGVSSRRRTALG